MKRIFLSLLLAALSLAAAAADPAPRPAIIPKPQQIEMQEGTFTWSPSAAIDAPVEADPQVALLREYFGTMIGEARIGGPITLRHDDAIQGEAYDLEITPQRLFLSAGTAAGWINGIQTLRQLVPPERLGKPDDSSPIVLPCMHIQDAPRYGWRGLMLDVSVLFSTKEQIEKLIDGMALYKLNIFHWHLTDDPGWRIEIKKYPKLTEMGAWRMENGKRYGGFYTQDDIREVVAYATARGVTIIPEIDMPSHAEAIIATYPEYSTKGGEPHIMPNQDRTDVLNPAREETYQFIDDVLTEVAALFPGPYIHTGGDELDTKFWSDSAEIQAFMKKNHIAAAGALRGYFERRVQKIVASKGKQLAVWQEGVYAGPLPDTLVMGWRYYGGVGLDDAAHGPVVESPQNPLYFDFPYTQNTMEKVYKYDPITNDPLTKNLTPTQVKNVIGIQGNMWSWIAHSPSELQGYIFPRLASLAENAWSDPKTKDIPDFLDRCKTALKQMEALGLHCDPLGVEQILDPEKARPKETGDGSIPLPGGR